MQKKLEILPNLETLIQRALEIVVEKNRKQYRKTQPLYHSLSRW